MSPSKLDKIRQLLFSDNASAEQSEEEEVCAASEKASEYGL